MRQFAVYKNPRNGSRRHAPYLLDVQTELVNTQLRVVIPLVKPDYFGEPMRHLNPMLKVLGKPYVLSPLEIGSLKLSELRKPVSNLDSKRDEILNAIDFMLRGF
ncbi:MAG: CcdB family protein [Panacagrimonas sp.]